MVKNLFYLLLFTSIIGCTSTKNTIKNIDYQATKPVIKKDRYIITTYADDPKYGYDKDYPVNLGFANLSSENYFVKLYFNGLTDEEGNSFKYEKIETCCPFPSNHNSMGVGLLHKYRITFKNGSTTDLYINLYEKGAILCPDGFKIAKE